MNKFVASITSVICRFGMAIAGLAFISGCTGAVVDSFEEGDVPQSEADALSGSLSIGPTADVYVRSGAYANTNYGRTATVVAAQGVPDEMQFYLRFDVPSVGSIGRARLRVYCANTTVAPIEIYSISSTNWNETAVTWNNRPPIDGPLIRTVPGIANLGWSDIDLTGKVVSGQPLSLAVLVRSTDVFTLYSKDYALGARSPQLILDPPAPVSPADVCGLAPTLAFGVTYSNQDNSTLQDDYRPVDLISPACMPALGIDFSGTWTPYGDYSGRDGAYAVLVPASQAVTVTLKVDPTTPWDPALILVSHCALAGLTCLGASDGVTDTEVATWHNSAATPQTVYVLVDSYSHDRADNHGKYSIRADVGP